MRSFLAELDALLRGHRTAQAELASGDVRFGLSIAVRAVLYLGGVYGLCMGIFAVTGGRGDAWLQILASTLKIPALFLLTLVVTSPSLYVFSALVGSHLRFWPVMRLLMSTLAVTVAVAASLAPVLAFFTLSSRSYSFMVLLNVVLLGAAGFVGVAFLRRALVGLMMTAPPAVSLPASAVLAPAVEGAPAELPPDAGLYRSAPIARDRAAPSDPSRRETAGLRIFRVWLVAYAVVGAQMGWLLRPFIGNPAAPFTWFRVREGSFFLSVLQHVIGLFK